MDNLQDIDAILAGLVFKAEGERPFRGVEAVAVRAIVALSRAGEREEARRLMIDLLAER